MASDRPEYKRLGWGGVSLTNQKYTPADGVVVKAQNAELVQDKTKGGRTSLRKRGGLPATGAAFGEGVYEMYEVKFVNGSDLTPDATSETCSQSPASTSSNLGDDMWSPEPLWAQIDEVTPSDVDFISTPAAPTLGGTANQCQIGLTGGACAAFEGVLTGGTISVRTKYTDNGLPLAKLQIDLIIPTSLGSFVGTATLTNADVLTTSYVTQELDLVTDFGYAGESVILTGGVTIGLSTAVAAEGYPTFNTVEVSWVNAAFTHA